ncbi:PREDICTED: DCC-interacting protein 13-alpha [Gavialis gangeticus]|uniref:DCC-interacting protein 13-alpha n=1 Tax=Gavialis gangeticus TaxID=94835 RepID=UPI00092EA144|nr:PREDICTED: DCC-interacting protein 13-alpha [Gavialis gangeticus]
MPGIDKLPIEETLEDSPQTRSLLGVFEEDAAAISSYVNQLYRAMHRIYDAQNELSAATHLTSKLLKEYEKQRFPLGGDDEVMSSTLQQFAKVIDELSSCHAVLSTQLADAMMFPITQFKERDLKEILTLKEVFQIASNDHDAAINRYSRLSKRRENEKVKFEVVEDVYTSRKKQHQTMMHYFCALNTLQYKKKISMLEPLLGYMQAQISFFKMGSENLTEHLEEFLTNIGTSVQNVRREMESEVETMQQTIEDLEVASDPLYLPDPDATKFPVHRNLTRKAGYLNARNKTGLVSSSWERQFYFTQGGNLMSQARGDVAGGLVMDIDNCSVMAVDCEDRRYCFQITSFDGKKSSILQAESKKDYEEGIAARVNQSALEAVTPSPSFQQRHESMRPTIQSRPPTAHTSSSGSLGSESAPLSTLSLDSLVAPDTPIQLDIISPVSEDQLGQAKISGQSGSTLGISSWKLKRNLVAMTPGDDGILMTFFLNQKFPLPNIALYATHQKNKRLFGFVLRTSGGRADSRPTSVCYIFESNNEGEKICDSVGLAKQIALHAELGRRASEKQKEIERVKEKQQKELSKQKQIEKEIAARVNQCALEAVTPSPSFQQRHESMRPTIQSCPPTARTSSSGSLGSESAPLSTLSLDSLVAPDTPIQFDIISPVSEDQPGQAKTSGQSGRRTNPFGESGGSKSETEDSILHQLFIVRFLGSMEVKHDETPDVVYETMRQILAARAIHNIFRMTESHLLVTCDCLKLIDPQTQVTRLRFPLPNIALYATHQENKRLFGFVLRTSGGRADSRPTSVCYIFESNNEGEKICDSVGLAKQIALHAELGRRASEKQKEIERVKEKQQMELSKQKQIEKDLEEQSRLIVASSRATQSSGEGQFVVLSSSQSKDSDLGEEGKKKRESEA